MQLALTMVLAKGIIRLPLDGASLLKLRWVMGLILVGLSGGFFVLTIAANGFRKSFGASEMNPLIQLLPIVAMLILLAGLVTPSNKLLLHIGAVAAIGLIGLCVWNVIYDAATILWLAVFYLLVWLYFYWRTMYPVMTS